MNKINSRLTIIGKHNQRVLEIVIIVHFAVSFIISVFGLGGGTLPAYLTSVMSEVIPSIHGTAALAPEPDSTGFILALSWLLIVPLYFYMLKRLPWDDIDWNKLNKPSWVLILLICVFAGFLNHLTVTVPDNSGPKGRFILCLIKAYTFTSSFWALIIWLSIWASLTAITLMIIAKLKTSF